MVIFSLFFQGIKKKKGKKKRESEREREKRIHISLSVQLIKLCLQLYTINVS